MKQRLVQGMMICAICLVALAASANTPKDVRDLVGVKAGSGERELESRGFVHITTHKDSAGAWGYWWNSSRRECISVATRNGRYDTITTSPSSDCNQYSSSGDKDNNGAAKAAIAIGAVALIGALAASHKSKHHDSGSHSNDNNSEQEFERGHNDGLYNHHYDNYNNSDAYSDGYDSGVEQRDHDTSYRHHSDRHDRGYQKQVSFDDLDGAKASSADDALNDRGFRNVDSFKEANSAYTIWYNRNSGQCLQMTVGNGRVVDISNIGYNAACR
jgi:hypothetical protein